MGVDKGMLELVETDILRNIEMDQSGLATEHAPSACQMPHIQQLNPHSQSFKLLDIILLRPITTYYDQSLFFAL